MKKVNRQKTIDETVYITEDGTEFYYEKEAKNYEWECKATKVYLILTHGRASAILNPYSIEIFSTIEKANNFLANRSNDMHYVEEIYLDKYLTDFQ